MNQDLLILETEQLCKEVTGMVHELELEPVEMNPKDFWGYIRLTAECIRQWYYLNLEGTLYLLAEEVLDKDYPMDITFYFVPPDDAHPKVQETEAIRQAELTALGEYYPAEMLTTYPEDNKY